MLRVLHQVSGRGALRLAGGHHPLLLGRGPVLRLRPRGAERHPDHAGEPLLHGHHGPRHPRHGDPDLSVHHLRHRLLLLRLRHPPAGRGLLHHQRHQEGAAERLQDHRLRTLHHGLLHVPDLHPLPGLPRHLRLHGDTSLPLLQHVDHLRRHEGPQRQHHLARLNLRGRQAVRCYSLERHSGKSLRSHSGRHLQHQRVLPVLPPLHRGVRRRRRHRHRTDPLPDDSGGQLGLPEERRLHARVPGHQDQGRPGSGGRGALQGGPELLLLLIRTLSPAAPPPGTSPPPKLPPLTHLATTQTPAPTSPTSPDPASSSPPRGVAGSHQAGKGGGRGRGGGEPWHPHTPPSPNGGRRFRSGSAAGRRFSEAAMGPEPRHHLSKKRNKKNIVSLLQPQAKPGGDHRPPSFFWCFICIYIWI